MTLFGHTMKGGTEDDSPRNVQNKSKLTCDGDVGIENLGWERGPVFECMGECESWL